MQERTNVCSTNEGSTNVTEAIAGELMTRPTTDGQPSLPRRSGARSMLPSTWVERSVRVSYVDAFGEGIETTGTLLDWCALGVIVNLAGEKSVLAWDCLRAVVLIND